MTLSQLSKQRKTFWETQPSYSGRPEVWAALKEICQLVKNEPCQLQQAQAILDSAGVTLPTGNLTDGEKNP